MEPLMPFSSSKRSFRRSGGISLRSARSSILIGLRGILIEAIRIVGLAEEARRAAFADDAGFLQAAAAVRRRAAPPPWAASACETWLPAVGKSAGLGGSSCPDGETLSGG